MSLSLQDQYTQLRKMTRRVARDYPPPLPAYFQDWWDREQQIINLENQRENERIARRRAELEERIAILQAELDSLPTP